ncbi:MAG: hypothetical protein WCH99_12380 [Verrucomicrobiota bacterium]
MKNIFFDIETGPLPEAELLAMLPPFDPAEVKTGNIKDPAKIAEKIAEAEANHRRDFIERAALDPLTGRVVAIGVQIETPAFDRETGEVNRALAGSEFAIIVGDDEAAILREFWALVRAEAGRLNTLIGFNSNQFDLPFLFRRSWKHGVQIPFGLRRGRYWGDQVVDIRDNWQLGDRMAKGSLAAIAKHLGLGEKSGSGKDFAALLASDRKAAEAYLKNDVELTVKVANALGVLV